MGKALSIITCVMGLSLVACFGFGGKNALILGECPLTVAVVAEDDGFDGLADVYINGHFIGTTDKKKSIMKIKLESGE
jgi:hypothetical protein